MKIFALADTHLSFGVSGKKMDIFGALWDDHPEQIAAHWHELVTPDDLVLIPGDISWAMTLDEVMPDLLWIDALPGTKVMIRGNHDYWWPSYKKLQTILPPSIKALHHNAITINNISICGTRFWDSPEFSFGQEPRVLLPEDEKIYLRELNRLEMACQMLDPEAKLRIALTHYPPIGRDLAPTQASLILEKYGVAYCLFGHLHFPNHPGPLFGVARGVDYRLTACDYLRFAPMLIAS
jgi:predicted phosphohydrolase